MKNKHLESLTKVLTLQALIQSRYALYFTFGITVFLFIMCKTEPFKTPFENANGKRGGIYYDTFWAVEGGFDRKDSVKIKKLNTFADFYKCNQCHAWDLNANKASYINRSPTKTRPHVSPMSLVNLAKTSTPERLFTLIKTGRKPLIRRPFANSLANYDPETNNILGDMMPDFSEILTDAQIWDIVKFMKTEVVDVTNLYDQITTGTYPTGKIVFSNIGKDGDATRGKSLFATKGCAATSCHGPNGTAILVDNRTYTIGGFVRAKPQEAQHKIKFGQLGSPMKAFDVTLQDLKDIYKAVGTDSIAFPLKK